MSYCIAGRVKEGKKERRKKKLVVRERSSLVDCGIAVNARELSEVCRRRREISSYRRSCIPWPPGVKRSGLNARELAPAAEICVSLFVMYHRHQIVESSSWLLLKWSEEEEVVETRVRIALWTGEKPPDIG